MKENKLERKKIYLVKFKNQYTRESKDLGECKVSSWDRHRVVFEQLDGKETHSIELFHSVVDIFNNMERTKQSNDTYYYDVKILALTDLTIKELWDSV